ncbi:Desmin [Merluccius polli]|uniref:Desmin n=1 Tax=Merluccius polli TaxID=89951 RepID=A0AA47M3W5_MERPO|nr:Desmin [Merluccius polli]
MQTNGARPPSRGHVKSSTLDVGPIVRPVHGTTRHPSPPCDRAGPMPDIRAPPGVNREPFARRSLRLSTMAMLRVSSYRRQFEEQRWRPSGAPSGGGPQTRTPGRGGAADECQCDKYDFVSAKALNKEGLIRFTQEHTVLSALNNRLVRLIELARCFEEENAFLESQILELENSRPSPGISGTRVAVADCSLDAVVDRLRKERDDILSDTEELRKEQKCLEQECEKALQQRTTIQHTRLDVAEEVDAVTAECLALREQEEIYRQQLASMEAQHSTAVERHVSQGPEGTVGAGASMEFCSPDIGPGLQIKAYYGRLAESLQCECSKSSSSSSSSSSLVPSHDPWRQAGAPGTLRSKGKESPKMADAGELKELVSGLCVHFSHTVMSTCHFSESSLSTSPSFPTPRCN